MEKKMLTRKMFIPYPRCYIYFSNNVHYRHNKQHKLTIPVIEKNTLFFEGI